MQTTAGDLSGKPDEKKPGYPKLNEKFFLLILFVFGGSLLALYYSRIRYFPEFTWEDSLTYLALLSILGVSIVIVYGFFLFVPGAIWSETLVFDQQLEPKTCYKVGDDWEPCLLSIATRFAIPFALFMAFCHSMIPKEGYLPPVAVFCSLAAISGYLWQRLGHDLLTSTGSAQTELQGKNDDKIDKALNLYLILLFLTHLPGFFVLLEEGLKPTVWTWCAALLPLATLLYPLSPWSQLRRENKPFPKAPLARHVGVFNVSALLSLASLLLIYRLVGSDTSTRLHVICTAVVSVANLLVALLYRKHQPLAALLSVAAALTLIVSGELLDNTGQGSALSARFMKRYGFGGEPNATLIVTPQGRKALQQIGILPAGGKEDDPGVLPNVKILSRLGTEYFFQVGDRKLSLPKPMVISWLPGPAPQIPSGVPTAPLAERKKTPESPSRAAQSSVQQGIAPARSSSATATPGR